MKKKRIGILPNMITAFGLSCGLFVVFKVNTTGFTTFEMLRSMTLILILAGVADLLDGAIARAIKAESLFGVMFDSLSDSISFGVAPAVLVLNALSLEQGTFFSFFAIASCMVYTLCGVFRLVRYNVKALSPVEGGEKPPSDFIGLPIPSAAAAIVSTALLIYSPKFMIYSTLGNSIDLIILCCTMLFVGYMMVSKWRFVSVKNLHLSSASFSLVFFSVMLAIFILYGLLYYISILLFVLSWGYIFLSFIANMRPSVRKKRNKQ